MNYTVSDDCASCPFQDCEWMCCSHPAVNAICGAGKAAAEIKTKFGNVPENCPLRKGSVRISLAEKGATVAIEKIEVYRTSDGNTYVKKADAFQHETAAEIEKIFEQRESMPVSERQFYANLVVAEAQRIISVLQRHLDSAPEKNSSFEADMLKKYPAPIVGKC